MRLKDLLQIAEDYQPMSGSDSTTPCPGAMASNVGDALTWSASASRFRDGLVRQTAGCLTISKW